MIGIEVERIKCFQNIFPVIRYYSYVNIMEKYDQISKCLEYIKLTFLSLKNEVDTIINKSNISSWGTLLLNNNIFRNLLVQN